MNHLFYFLVSSATFDRVPPRQACAAVRAHAWHFADRLELLGCELFAVVAPEDIAEVCAKVRESWRDVEQKLAECAENGCTGVPSINSVIQVPPCCN